MNLLNLAEEIKAVYEEKKRLEFDNDLLRRQLYVILMNNGGKLEGLKYTDLRNVDEKQIGFTIGLSECHLVHAKTLVTLHSEAELPQKPIPLY